jgi:L-rhamnose mutarotase
MGLANNEILKIGVDALTTMLETLNKITDAISGGNGLMKAVVSLTTVLSGLSLGRSLLPSILGSVGGIMGIGPKVTDAYDKEGNLISHSVTSRETKAPRSGLAAAIARKKAGGKFFSMELTDDEMQARRLAEVHSNKEWKKIRTNISQKNNAKQETLDKMRDSKGAPIKAGTAEYE